MGITGMSGDGRTIGPDQYRALARFRHELRRFLSFSEAAATAAGLPVQQHQALLAIAGHGGPGRPSVGALAEQLVVAPHTAAELASRMAEAGLIHKNHPAADRRRTELTLTDRAEALLAGLTAAHLRELEQLEPALTRALRAADPPRTPA